MSGVFPLQVQSAQSKHSICFCKFAAVCNEFPAKQIAKIKLQIKLYLTILSLVLLVAAKIDSKKQKYGNK